MSLSSVEGFRILESRTQAGDYQPVSPDLATCPDCLHEIIDPADRRHDYAFTNCTNCGPRFTIIDDIPYDRPLTTMRRFRMCPACQAEYDTPTDRRFHAQPNACPACGPRLELFDAAGNRIDTDNVVAGAAEMLRQGDIIAVKGLGGFQLACDASNGAVVAELRKRKQRPGKPLAVMLANLDEIRRHCELDAVEAELITSAAAPIVLLCWRKDSDLAPEVAPGNRYLGVMLPYTPLHNVLLRAAGMPLVMTSGNLSEEPICRDNDEALRRLGGIADYFILHDRDIRARYDDSVALVTGGTPGMIRRARGYAPSPITLSRPVPQIFATGGQEKNAFCLTRDRNAFLSQHIGDMENAETLAHYEDTLALYKRLFRVVPEVVAHDAHPDYATTRFAADYAAEWHIPVLPVQHHHAHVVSCLAENGHHGGPVIGVAFDGTGYGTDGAVWGGEFLVCEGAKFTRAAHLEYVPMPGGEACIRRPGRMAFAYLESLAGGADARLPLVAWFGETETEIIRRQMACRLNAPLTSSAGRLFDAVAALCGFKGAIQYEAQAAIYLEMAASGGSAAYQPYPYSLEPRDGCYNVRLGDLIAAVEGDVLGGVGTVEVAARFHRTVSDIILKTVSVISTASGISTVALSGGVFQNRLLLSLAREMLADAGFTVLSHRLVPANDGGLALGQALIAAMTLGDQD